jgi:glycosyltransferase involved in cell wall biosynthesis
VEVSIITPTYNRPDLLKKALASVAAQTFHDYEVVIVNDCGCPLESVIEESGIKDKIQYIQNPKNMGQTISLNIGLKNAKGNFIAYLDDDDIYFSNHLEVLHKFLSSKNCDFAYTNCIRTLFNSETGAIIKREILPSVEYTREKLLNRNFIHIVSVMHRKKCLEKSGMFDENLMYMKDWDLFVRISEHYKFYHIKEMTCEAFFRTDKSNMTFQHWDTRVELAKELRLKYLEKYKNSRNEAGVTVSTYSKQLEQALIKFTRFQETNNFLITHFEEFKKKGIKNAAIFGASLSGQIYLDYLTKVGIKVLAFFDNDPKKQGNKINDIEVFNPEKIINFDIDGVIIASLGFKDEIYQQIQHLDEKNILVFKE